nr:sugar kinase [Actinacidiphila yeochonensis]
MGPAAPVDVVCLGETMVAFVPSRPGPLAEVPSFHRAVGGAESNVACALARSGHSARWISRVGADGFGDHVVATVAAAGVDTSAVRRDPHRPTGVYFRTAGERAATLDAGRRAGAAGEVVYYRAGSAASAMSPELVPRSAAWSGRVLHLTGITAALSPTCRELLRELTGRAPGRPLLSFDLNHRPALWRGLDPSWTADLARACDLVFVGEDEARAAWGLPDADAVRAALPEPAVLVVKQGEAGATVFASPPPPTTPPTPGRPAGAAGAGAGTRLHVPAPAVEVVAHVGAGDGFAAGFLSATLRGLPLRDRLRHGHLMAAAALTVPGDLAEPPSRARLDALAALDDASWAALRLAPGWTAAGLTPGTVPGAAGTGAGSVAVAGPAAADGRDGGAA